MTGTPHLPAAGPTSSWRAAHFVSLLDFARPSLDADGAAGWLDDEGTVDPTQPAHLWITCRMTHTFGLGHLLGVEDAGALLERGIGGLSRALADAEHGGWLASRGPGADLDGLKQAYGHAFVVLAGSTGTVARTPGAITLLEAALSVLDERFWEADRQLHLDERSRDWDTVDPYRGVNANMHSVEALLAAHDATGERRWLDRAATVADRVIEWASGNGWRIPEHFDTSWQPQLEYNADRPHDPFKPYGATPGHGLEWARLLLQVDVAAGTAGRRTDAARQLFERAVADGWDGPQGGFVYTTDWSGKPVEARRFHWVAAEAAAAADVLHRTTGEARFGELADQWWGWIDVHLVDHDRGSWFHELDADNVPSGRTWIGKPDVYHAAQAVILPDLPLTGSFAASAREAGPLLAGARLGAAEAARR
ncbi:AGE family epimerase/isomerase [Krasilnikoviella flava]|uniref:Mannose or cellobiose epimerase, N-acyl-D-glucosamine 2-epimerase family n=1 Tax=Krasilnikoviella flava TaxID=526729 RepID=A0A1T5IUN2_9MICO|nr:AGE family epimerase/isomerase [Krasilnikoviella flava]SKC42864.1 Mannose or cellobiose epimerase, N-acyl-D-glucosamine 2-epimerase family [Krasilnikoviella flava]